MCKSVSLLSLLLVAFLACSSVHLAQGQELTFTLCSQKLTEMMNLVCKSFNSMLPQKRSLPSNDLDDPLNPLQFVERNEIEDSEDSDTSAYGKYFRNSLSAIRRRTREGIVDRCCKRYCSMKALKEYCEVAY
ncbi:probable insulin-like peptide 2 [Drosophila elegans]|uniref:probable insulin-like peptide 2 n=1 Tax=Drosophila elegans TaxID=30023 RepID=UPI0007E87669|nr:probable insulin-like peptide 2 [Drosophila elegans]